MRKWIKTKQLSAKLLVVLCALAIGWFAAEGMLRLLGYSFPLFYTTDYYCGFALRPGVEGLYHREGESYVRINSDGLRDDEHSKIKPANTVRIALLGDSYAEAMHVPIAETFWSLLEQQLRECNAFSGKEVKVLNFGVSGYGTAQELLTLRQQVWDYSPDIVLLTVTTNNDIYDNSRALSRTEEVPYFVYRNGELAYDASFRDSPTFRWRDSTLNKLGRWVRDHSRVMQLIHYAHFTIRLRIALRQAQKFEPTHAQAQHRTGKVEDLGIDNRVYREPEDEAWKDAWVITENLIVQMRNEVEEKGAKFLVVTLSNAIQVYPDAAVRQAFMQHVGVNHLFYPVS